MRVDPTLLRSVHREVGDRLHREQQRRRPGGAGRARRLGGAAVRPEADRRHGPRARRALLARGQSPLDPEAEQELAEGVYARMFGAGRLQGLLNDDDVENIDINGCDEVWVTRAGRRPTTNAVDAVATNDEELIELIQSLARLRRA